jgi:hypothetical protein
MIVLYLKESPFGLKYLGKTTKDPYKYNGSGLVWKRHIKKYKLKSTDITTKILFQTNDKIEFSKIALEYSILYNIVNSDEFANLTCVISKYSNEAKNFMAEIEVSKIVFYEDIRDYYSQYIINWEGKK